MIEEYTVFVNTG